MDYKAGDRVYFVEECAAKGFGTITKIDEANALLTALNLLKEPFGSGLYIYI